MKLKHCLRATACALFVAGFAGSAQATTIVVTPTLAPNLYGSPNAADWASNSNTAKLLGLSSYGDPSSPSHYLAQTDIDRNDLLVTSFKSWNGFADPGTVFGPAYANELGTRAHFGVLIDGEGQLIRLSDMSVVMDSNDAGNSLDWTWAAGRYTYDSNWWGVQFGADNVLGGSDDTIITSGPNTQLVNMIVGVGAGNANWPGYGLPPEDLDTVAERQAAIDAEVALYDYTQFTGTYTLGSATGTGTFNISAPVPEPATWLMMIAGFGAIGGMMRRKRGVGGKALAMT